MPPSRTRFVTACQQLLALGVVLAALTPAASVVSLDVVHERPAPEPAAVRGNASLAGLSAYTRASSRKSVVPAEVVDPAVTEYALTAPEPSGSTGTRKATKTASLDVQARSKPGALPRSTEIVSVPQPVTGYGAVGVTWEHGEDLAEDELSFEVRTRTADEWSDWIELEYEAEHGPDPDTAEGRRARPGTDALLVGDVDQVQVRALATDVPAPDDMRLAVIDPGTTSRTAVEAPALDTNAMADDTGAAQLVEEPAPAPEPAPETDPATEPGTDGLDLEAAMFTPKPVIYSRAQWGADERMRDKGSLRYFEVHAGFVHHTVNANSYSRAEVPGILRSIYAYHTQSKGWSDVGYNYLVDRFGRIWEGRYGGIDRAVVGAHTLGYNEYSFAMSAIGNYDIKKPSSAMVQAYGALFAWKLSLHGVDASSTRQQVGSSTFQGINGHRDAGQTACPGRYLYAKLGKIRSLAADAQRGWAGRELESDLASTPHPDIVVRRASDGQLLIVPTGGLTQFARPVPVGSALVGSESAVASPDLTGDGRADLAVQAADGTLRVFPGDGAGGLGAPTKAYAKFAQHDLVTAVGDLNADGRNDLVARRTDTGRVHLYLGNGQGGFARRTLADDWSRVNLIAATGDLNGDGLADILARDSAGLWLYPGTGSRQLGARTAVPGQWARYDMISGFGDFSGDGKADLIVREPGKRGFVLPGDGRGRFGHELGPIGRFKGASAVSGANLTGGSAPDVLARKKGALVVIPNKGTFDAGAPIPTGVAAKNANLLLNAGDWDRDGHGDVIVRTKKGKGALFLRRGDGAGGLSSPVKLAGKFGNVGLLAAVGDMTGDGYPDLMGQPAGGSVRLYPGRGLDGLRRSYPAYGKIDAGAQVGIGRWDADGAPDSLFRRGNRLTLFPGNGPGGLTGPKSLGLDLAPYDWVLGVSDVKLTGHPDLIVRSRATGYLWVLQGTNKGFRNPRFLAEGMQAYDLAG